MNTTQHTPGPWHINATAYCQGSPCRWEIVAKGGGVIAETNDGTDKANARLIAAAPDLLSALEAMVSTYRTFRDVPKDEQEWTSLDDDAMDSAISAIAKAKGEVK